MANWGRGAEGGRLGRRREAVNRLLERWWDGFRAARYQQLMSVSKWKERSSNLQVGDMVLLLDRPSPLGAYQLGRVHEVYADAAGLVRRVKVMIKPKGSERFLDRHVRTLSKISVEISE